MFSLLAQNLSVCDIDPELKEELRKFRFRKATNNAAIISNCFFVDLAHFHLIFVVCFTVKVDRERQMICIEDKLEV